MHSSRSLTAMKERFVAESQDSTTRPLLGIGSCLAGNAVRYNGQLKSPSRPVRDLCEYFDTRAFCPEMGIGLGVPRPPIRLVGTKDEVRIMDVETQTQDYTAPIQAYADTVLKSTPEMAGYILVKASPSCGVGRVKRYSRKGHYVASDQDGVFTSALSGGDPLLPLEDDDRLNDPALRESFVTRAFTYHRWKRLLAAGLSAGSLVEFYSRHKYLAMAHHVPSYKLLGHMMADAGNRNIDRLKDEFIATLMTALANPATRRSHTNVLFHLSGYLKRSISSPQRQRLSSRIEEYRTGQIPLAVPITMLRHHFADHPDAYIDYQVFLEPFPRTLKLHNLV
ncbi:MAG: DUF523 and DUF1722 domain-containing protein [Pseudomonadota bacterium]